MIWKGYQKKKKHWESTPQSSGNQSIWWASIFRKIDIDFLTSFYEPRV